MKCGKSTGTTYGTLSSCNFSVRVSEPLCSDKYFIFKNCYAVINNKQEKPFLGEGDSGSGVFVVDQDKALGIAFSSLGEYTIVCKIEEILENLDLKIVRYIENPEEST